MRLRPVAAIVVALVALAGSVRFADSHRHVYDLTAQHSLTLTDQTRTVIRGVRQPVTVTAFLAANDAGRAEAGALLERYHRLNRRITYELVDPQAATTKLQRLKVDPSVDALAVWRGSKVARAPTVTEQDITSGLAQVSRAVSATICVASGHGEIDPSSETPDGMAAAARLLTSNGYTMRVVDLLTVDVVPTECTGLILAAPTAPLGQAGDAIGRFLRANGRALVLADPVSTVDLSPLLRRYHLTIERGIAQDPNRDAHLPDDAATLIVRDYRSGSPVVRSLPPTVFPGADAVVIGTSADAGGLSAVALAETSGRGYLERRPQHDGFTPGEDLKGPVTLVAAADLSRVVRPDEIVRSRVVVGADVDFATNAFIGVGGNARLLVQAIDWITASEDLVPLNANVPAYRPLALTAARTRSARVLAVGVVPSVFVLAGLGVWVVRRRR